MERNSSDNRERGMGRNDRGDRGQDMDRDGGQEKGMKKNYRSKFRPDYPADFEFDYKDPVTLGRFIMESGKIVPSRISKLSSAQQKKVAAAIRKARSLALLPNGTEAYDTFERPETISPKPFSID
ncbi:MAG TPA: 30S ribosomal protein S18 [Bdellovibrionales bacterium]|nr:30S ribosomal protein S18 [Bdellovibrionales bacterium]